MSESNDDSLDSVLCFLCTPSSTGCKVVGTVSVSATDSLADIRERLITASCGGESESKVGCTSYEVSCKSSGVSLNGFDFSSQFRYIRNSTVIIPISRERSILARDLFPRLPFRAAKFNHVLRQSWEKVLKTNPEVPLFTVCKSTEGHVRHLLCVLFVSHVESSTIGITASPPRIIAERAFLERLSLSPHISSFGRYFEASASWQKGLSRDNVNVRDYLGFSLLHESMIAGETIAFGHILQVSGVQVDITDNRGNTPLHLAVSLSGRETFVNALLEAGADPLAQNFSGDTPLHLSFSYKRPIAQGILCSHLRKFSHKDKDYILDLQNNFGVSIRSLFLSSVSFLELLQKGTKEAVHSFCTHFLYESERMSSLLYQWNGNSALHVAGEGGNEEVLRYLLSNGDKNPLIWELNHRHETPLHVASRLGHIKCANILVEKYPHHLSMIDIGGNTPFLLAVKSKSVGMITHMCSCYSAEQLNLHIRDARGWSALHLLCGFGFFDIAENILISHHLSFRDENVRKSFCCWYDEGNRDSIVYNKILVKQNTRLASRQRRRAITSIERISNEHYICGKESFFHEHLASESLMYSSVLAANREKSKDRCHFLLLLCKHGAVKTAEDCANMFVYFIRKRRDELLNEIIENSSRFGIESPLIEELKTQNSLLCIFCASRDNYGIRWCVESKFAGIFSGSLDDIRTPQHSPLHISISLGDAAAVEFLLSHHVSPNIEPLEKRVSPLSWALQHPSTAQSAIIEALVRSGSRVVRERADSSIWNAIEEASILNNEYAVRALVGCDSSGVTLALESALQKAAFNELLRIRRNTKGENEHKNLGRICAFLSEHACWSSSNVHPYELISLAAHAHFFEVVENLIKKLLQGRTYLSDASLPFLKVSAPPPPPMPQREIIAPKPTIPVGCKNCGTRKALYAPKKTTYTRYYRRLLLPSCIHRVDIQRVEIKIEGFPHRLVRRDAFSFLAEYGRVDLMESLFDLHFTPWEGGDRRGWSPADYAIRGLKREAFRFLVEHGVFPLCQHGEADILLKSTIYGSLIRSAISFFSEGTVTPPVVIQTMLKNRVDDSVIMNYSRTSLGTFMVKNQVDSGSPAQFPVSILEECVRLSRLSLLSFFVEEYRLQVQHFETLLLWGAITENEETIEWLIQHGCSLTASATLPETVNLPLALKKVFRKWKSVSPLFLAVAACSLSTISVMVLCTPCLLSLPPSVVVGRVICGDGNISRGSASSNVESPATPDGKDVLVALAERIRNLSSLHLEAEAIEIVKVLSRCGLPYCSSQVIQAACKKHFYSLIVNLLKCYGKEVVLADLDYLRNLSPPTSFYGTLFHAVAVNEGVCVAFEELLAVQNNTDLIENLTNFAKAQFRYQLSCLGSTVSDSRNIVGGTIYSSLIRLSFAHGSCRAIVLFSVIGFFEFQVKRFSYSRRNAKLSLSNMSRAFCLCNRHYGTNMAKTPEKSDWQQTSYSLIQGVVELGDLSLLERFIIVSKKVQSSFLADVLRDDADVNRPTIMTLCLRHKGFLSDTLLKHIGALTMNMKACDLTTAIQSEVDFHNDIYTALHSKSVATKVDLLFSSVDLSYESSHNSFFLGKSRCRLKQGSPFSVALFVGNAEWVQYTISIAHEYLSTSEPGSNSSLNKNFETDVEIEAQEWCSRADQLMESNENNRKRVMAKNINANMPLLSKCYSWKSYKCGLVLLTTITIINAYWSHDTKRLKESEQVFSTLIASKFAILSPSELNTIAISLASMQRWGLLSRLIHHAQDLLKRYAQRVTNSSGEIGDRFFFTVSEAAISPLLKRIVGGFRHVIHATIARSGRREHIMMIARHSQRADVEKTADAQGRRCWYMALHYSYINSVPNHSLYMLKSLKTFEGILSLKLPMTCECCVRTGRTLLHLSAMHNRLDIMKQCCLPNDGPKDNSCGIDSRDKNGCTALMLAARFGHMESVEFLLERKANPSLTDRTGFSAAMYAAASGKDDVAKFLLTFTKDEDFNDATDRQHTYSTHLIHCIAKGGCTSTCESLLKNVRDPVKLLYMKDESGNTALTISRGFGHGKIVRLLVTTQSVAMSSSNKKEAKWYLETAEPQDKRILFCDASLPRYGWLSSAMLMKEEIIKAHLDHKPSRSTNFSIRNHQWSSTWPLKWCAENNYLQGIRSLADRNVGDNCFALHSAALRGLEDVVDLLLYLKMSNAATKATMTEILETGKPTKRRCTPSRPRSQERYLPFELAALSGYETCALRLLSALSDYEVKEILLREAALISQPTGLSGGLLHRLAIACNGVVLQALVKRALSVQGDEADVGKLLSSLIQHEDESGLSVIEYTLCMGEPDAFLRCVELTRTLPRKGLLPSAPVVFISPALLHFLPSLSPSIRVILFDVLDMIDACRTAGFEKRRNRKHSRLSFGDVRLVGIEKLKENPHCAACTSLIFTPQHERIVLGYKMQKWKHLIRFQPNEFGTLTPSEQSMYLQWLGSSLVLSTYAQLSVKKVKKINIVIRSPHIKEAPFFHYKKGVVTHSLGYCAGKNGHTIAQILEPHEVCSFSFNALRKKWRKHLFDLCFQAKKRIEALPFPWFKEIDVVVHWNVERAPIRGTTATEDAAYWERVIDCLQISMERLVSVLEFRIPTITNELSEADFNRYYSSGACCQVNDSFKLMYFFMDDMAPSTLDEQLKGLQAPVCFSDNQYPDEKPLLQCWCRHIEREAATVRLAYLRELFLKRMATILERKCNKNVGVSMTFELEEHHCAEVFFPTLTRLITEEIPNAIKAVISLSRKKSLPRSAAVSSRAIPLSYPNGYISNKFRKYFSKVIVTYAHPGRNINSLLTEYDCDEGVIRIFFFNDVIPCEFDILTAITEKLALHLKGRAERHLLSFIRENESQLRTYMPYSSLRVEFNLPRNNEENNGEDLALTNSTSDAHGIRATQIVHHVLLGYHLLYHDHSVYALSPLLEALRSLSSDKRIKSDKLSKIKEVIVRIGTDQWSSISFNENLNALVYFVSLRSEELLPSTVKVLSAEEIASSIKAEMNMN